MSLELGSYLLGKKAGGGGTGTLQTKQVEVTSNGSQDITADTGYDGLSKVELTTNVQPTLQTKSVSISTNGTTTVSKDSDYDGMTSVSVTTNVQPDLESKSVTITENTTTTITPSQDKDGLSSVSVITNVPQGITPTGTISITQNGTVDVTNYASADVNVSSSQGWQRPSDWWDTETILANAETRQDNNGNTVYPAYIILFDDSNKQTTFSKLTTNKRLDGDGYLTSDGSWYGTTDATHTWDETKDKSCSLGYKTRYVIVYVRNKFNQILIHLQEFPCLEIIVGDCNVREIICGSSSADYPYNTKIQNVIFTDDTINSAIAAYAFSRCSSLKNVSFPNVTTINNEAFRYCYVLENISFPSATTLGNYCFQNCGLNDVSFPNVTTINKYCFQNCTRLNSIDLPELTTLNFFAFGGCRNLKTISFPKLETYDSFDNIYKGGMFNNCNSLEKLTIPSTLITIYGNNASNMYACFGEFTKALILPQNFELNLFLQKDEALTHSALVDIISKLKDFSGSGETHTLNLGTINSAKLSSAEISVATNKGWTVGTTG